VDTLAELLSGLAVEHDTRVALVEGDRALTFDGLAAAAGALAAELAGWGVGRGDVVALWLPNVLEYLVAEFALGALGAAALGVNTRYGEHELAHLVDRARPVAWSCRTGSWTSTSWASCRAQTRGWGWSGRRRALT
jgi:fatty-acyl-CoA synthase